MNRINNFLFALLATILFSCSSRPTQLFVATNGSDSNGTGTIGQPFASPERARDEIRRLKKEGEIDKGYQVNLREGTYYRKNSFLLSEEDSGIENAPIVYSAYKNEKVIIHGGISIPVEKKNSSIVPEVLSRFQATVQDKIVEIDLQQEGISDYGKMRPVGFARSFGPTWAELFINGEPYGLAR